MFEGCISLKTLDLSGFDTSACTGMAWMFYNCSSLKTIYAGSGWTTANLEYDASSMFYGCTSLVGGNGTKFNSSYTNQLYARIDAAGQPGYLSVKKGFVQDYDGWYYYEADGTKRTNAWVVSGSSKYWCGEDGKLVMNDWVQVEGLWYYFDSTGKAKTSATNPNNKKTTNT